ncbi:MAG: hypothetical protein AAFY71_01640 [Bacteroidota bacterium]
MERDLHQQLAEGKITALREAYESYFSMLFLQAKEKGVPQEDAESMIHQLFFDLWEKKGKITSGESHLQFLQTSLDDMIVESNVVPPEHSELEKAVKKLSPEEQRSIELVIWKGSSLKDAAQSMDLTINDLSALLSGAMAQLLP